MDLITLTANLDAPPIIDPSGRRVRRARLYRLDVATRDRRRLRFTAGALKADQERVPVLYAHMSGNPLTEPIVIGSTRNAFEADGAAWADFVFARTAKAREIEQLVADGDLSKVSVGVMIEDFYIDEDTGDTVVTAFDLVELSIVPVPAMRDADISADSPELIRLNQGGEMPDTAASPEPTSPPASPEPTSPPATAEVNGQTTDLDARLAALEDQVRAQSAREPQVTVTPRAAHRTAGQVITDVILMDRNRDQAATERLGPMMEAGRVRTDGPARIIDLAFATPGLPGTNTEPQTGYVPELLELLRNAQATSAFFAQRNLDEVPGQSLVLPKVAVGGVVNYQVPGGAVASQTQDWSTDSYPKATLAGGQGVTVQARDWSSPSYMDSVIRDLVAAYGEKLNLEAVAGDGAAGPPAHHRGAITAAGAPIAVGVGTTLIEAIGTAKGAVFTATKRWPTHFIASGATLGVIDGLTGTDGRPLLATDGGANAIGTEVGPSPAGTIRGLNAIADDAVPAQQAIVTNFRDAELWESEGAPVQVGLTYPDVLTIDVTVFGYSAVAIRRAGAFKVISAIVEPVGLQATEAKTTKSKAS